MVRTSVVVVFMLVVLMLIVAGCALHGGPKDKPYYKGKATATNSAGALAADDSLEGNSHGISEAAGRVRLIDENTRILYGCSRIDSVTVRSTEERTTTENILQAHLQLRRRAALARGNAVMITDSRKDGTQATVLADMFLCDFKAEGTSK